jgi:hypothetical protein
MPAKIKQYEDRRPGKGSLYAFHCPGCGYDHGFHVDGTAGPQWAWNKSFDSPTFHPSLFCNQDFPNSRCHSFVRDGRIQFLSDCWHKLAGQTVDLPDWKDE